MNKRYIIKSLLICMMLTGTAGPLMAQTEAGKADADSSAVPGRFFNSSKPGSTGAVSTVSGRDLYKTPTANLTNTLYGRLPGLSVGQGSGEPGNDAALLGIRGVGTYGVGGSTSGYNTFKYFVDGFETNANYFNYLSPAEIESVSVLKDAASLATFGMRGSNGVIWVTTKRGKVGKATISFQTRTGFQSPTKLNKPLDAYNYANLYNQAVSNDNNMNWAPRYTDAQLAAYQNGSGTNVDFYKEVLRNNTPYTDGDLIFNGGDTTARYNVVFNYANQKGLYNVSSNDITKNQTFVKYNLRTNLNFNLFKIFEARVDLGGRLEDRTSPNYSSSQLFADLASYPSNIYPVMQTDTRYSGTALYPNNPYASTRALGWQSTHTKILQGNFGLREKLDFITPGLYLDESVSFNSYSLSSYAKTSNYARYFNGATTTTATTTPIVAGPLNTVSQEDWKQIMFTLGYDRQLGQNHLTAAVNYHQSDFRGDGLFGYIYHYQNFSGRANYNYKNKYVAEFGFSYFGTDSYAPDNRWGFYPAVSAAWILSNESFLQNSATINYLKLRASVGRTGNSDSNASGNALSTFGSNGRFLYQQYYTGATGVFYTGNGTPTQAGTLAPLFIANPNIFAEQSVKYNVGLDMVWFKALNVTVDAFMDKRSNIITLDNSIPASFGNNIYFNNVGKMTNKGFEVTASYTNNTGAVGYNLTGMASYNKNTIDYQAEVTPAYAYNAQTGRPYGTQIGLVSNGFYQLADFNADGTLKAGQAVPAFGRVQPGDLKYQDLNNDGRVDQTDVTQIGNSIYPTLTYSFGGSLNYKGFDVSVFLQGTSGATVNTLYSSPVNTSLNPQTVAFVNNGNAYANAQGAWAYYPAQGIDTRATATYPRLTTQGNNNNYRPSSFWIRNADFLRVRNAELGYTFNTATANSIMLSKLRIYVNAVNPITWSKLMTDNNIDPESYTATNNGVYNGYPALRSVNVGITATFK